MEALKRKQQPQWKQNYTLWKIIYQENGYDRNLLQIFYGAYSNSKMTVTVVIVRSFRLYSYLDGFVHKPDCRIDLILIVFLLSLNLYFKDKKYGYILLDST